MGSVGRLLTVEKDGVIVAGIRAVSVSWASESIDLSQGEPDGYRFLAEIDGLETISLSVEGVTKSDLIRNIAYSRAESRLLENITITWPPMGEGEIPATLQGSFFIDAYSEDAPYNDAYTFTMTLNSSALIENGEIVSGGYIYTPGFVAPGEDWGPLTKDLGLSLTGTYRAYSGHAGFVVITNSSQNCARSTDDGVTWTSLPAGLNNGFGAKAQDIFYSGGVYISGWTGGGASRSTDGLIWSALPQSLNNGADIITRNVSALAANGSGKWLAVFERCYAAQSLDDGVTWTARPQFLGVSGPSALDDFVCISCNESGVWMSGHDNGFADISTDDGVTFTAMVKGLNNAGGAGQQIRAIRSNNGATWLAGFANGWLSRTTDNGMTWENVTLDTTQNINYIYYEGGAWVIACDFGNAFRSIDGGLTFTQLPLGLNSGSEVVPVQSISGNGSVLISVSSSGYVARSPPL